MIDHTVSIGDLELDCGATLRNVEQRVTIDGTPDEDGGNVVLIPHALTGSSRVADWWPGFVGAGTLLDPAQWCIVGINVLGGAYGSTGPSGVDGPFPRITVSDAVLAQRRALDAIGIAKMGLAIGGSLGGMQVLQWALDAPERIGEAIVIGAHDHHSAMGVAFNAIQRECLEVDPVRGLGLARKVAMLTYKSEALFTARHGRRRDRADATRFDIEGYLDHQARKFEGRMDAATYATLTRLMDGFDVRDRADEPHPPLTFVGITSDWLFRPQDIEATAARFGAAYLEMESDHGHDAFLAEPLALTELLRPLVAKHARTATTRSS